LQRGAPRERELPGERSDDHLGRGERSGRAGQRARDLLDRVALDDVADLHVVEVRDADAALEALAYLPDVVLEPLEGTDLAVVHDDAVADHARPALAVDAALRDVATGDRADLADLEGLAHLGRALDGLLLLRREQALERRRHVVDRLVDDVVDVDV